MRVVLYIRVSTAEQANEGYSIEAQKRSLMKYCELREWQIVDNYIDAGFSAKDTDRPEMQRLLTDLPMKKFDLVLIFKLDRLTRSIVDLHDLLKRFEAQEVTFESINEEFETRTANGRLMLNIMSVFAQFEREQLGERVTMGMQEKAKQGKKPGGRYPFGYDKEGNLIESEAETLRELRRLYLEERLGMQSIAVQLNINDLHLRRRGKKWTASTVGLTLENPFLAGIIQFGSKLPNGKYPLRKKELRVDVIRSKGDHTPIWTEEEYNEHLILLRSRSDGGYSRKLDYWFSTLLRCGRCGASMYGRLTTKRSLKDGSMVRTPYYWCSNRKANKSCDLPMLRQSHIEHMVFEYIRQFELERELIEQSATEHEKRKKDQDKALAKAKRELEEIKERKKKWQYAFANDSISVVDLKERTAEEEILREAVEVRINLLQVNREQESSVMMPKLQSMESEWLTLNSTEKQEALRAVFKQITIHTDAKNVKGVKNAFFPAKIEVMYQ